MAQIEVNGISLSYELSGNSSAPILMFSNSLASNLSMWNPQAEAFGGDYQILRYDSRGHGQSDAPDGPYSIEMLADDAIALLDALGIDKVRYCGLSKGGMVGQMLATKHADRLHCAVLCATSSYMGPKEIWQDRIDTANSQGMTALSDGTLERWFTPPYHESDPAEVDKVRQMIHSTPVAGYAACCQAIAAMDQRESIKSIDLPTLVIVGDKDPGTTPEMAEAIHQSIKGSRIAVLKNAAHFCNMEQRGTFNEALSGFLNSIG